MGSAIGEAYLESGQDMTQLAIKTASDERLSQEEISILVGQANSRVITKMHEKVASGSLAYGSIYPTINPIVVVREVRLRALGPDPVCPIPPPARDYQQEVRDLLARSCPDPAPAQPFTPRPEYKVEELMRDPLKIHTTSDEDKLRLVRHEARTKLESLRGQLMSMNATIRDLSHRLEDMMSQVVDRNSEPASALKMAMSHMKVASSIFEQKAAERRWDVTPVPLQLAINEGHPLIKAAYDLERIHNDHALKLAHFDHLELVLETTNTRLVEMAKEARRR